MWPLSQGDFLSQFEKRFEEPAIDVILRNDPADCRKTVINVRQRSMTKRLAAPSWSTQLHNTKLLQFVLDLGLGSHTLAFGILLKDYLGSLPQPLSMDDACYRLTDSTKILLAPPSSVSYLSAQQYMYWTINVHCGLL